MSNHRIEDRGIGYTIAGDGERGDVLALHSLGTDHRIWGGTTPALVEAGFRVIAPDSRGHGASADGSLPDAATWVDDLVAVLDDAGTDRVDVVGVSMGAAQALELALRTPGRVRSLLLTGAFGDLDPVAGRQKAAALSAGPCELGMARWAERYTADTLVADDPAAHRTVRDAIAAVTLEAYTASAEACFAPRSGDLAAVTVPTLVVWGERDHKTPEELSLALVADLPHARLVHLADGGHLAPIDVPDAFAAVVVGFLTGARDERAGRQHPAEQDG